LEQVETEKRNASVTNVTPKKRGKGRGTKWILWHFADKRENLRKPMI
jgi:hypothetical protein